MVNTLQLPHVIVVGQHQALGEQWVSWLTDAGYSADYQSHVPQHGNSSPDQIFLIEDIIILDHVTSDTLPASNLILCMAQPDNVDAVLGHGVHDVIVLPATQSLLIHRLQQLQAIIDREHIAFAEMLQQTAAALSATLDLQEVLQLILTHVHQVMPYYDSANVILLNEDNELTVTRNHQYVNSDRQFAVVSMFEKNLEDIPNLARMYHTQQPVYVADATQHEDWVQLENSRHVMSLLAAPIIVRDQVIGFINLESETKNSFSHAHAGRLQAFAHHAGLAIQNARLYTQKIEMAENLEALVQERTEELQKEKAQLDAILNTIDEGVIFYDASGRPLYMNEALADLFGYSEADWMSGQTPVMLALDADEDPAQINERIEKTLSHYGVWHDETTLRRADGSAFDAEVAIRRLVSDDTSVDAGSVTVYRDISQERALRERQIRFVSYASHELRTPITNLKTRLYLIRRQPDKITAHIGIIEEVVEHMQGLVETLLEVSRLTNRNVNIDRQVVTVQNIVHAVYRVQSAEAEKRDISLLQEMPQKAIRVYGDESRLIQVLTNLVTNALHHTENGGEVSIGLRVEAAPDMSVSQSNIEIYDTGIVHMVQYWAVLRVEDNGQGINHEHLPHIFQPFYHTESTHPGIGLGLTIASEIARLHNGTITVDSSPGKGSCFSLWLPMSAR